MNNVFSELSIIDHQIFPLLLLFLVSSGTLILLSTSFQYVKKLKNKYYRTYVNTTYILISTIALMGITIVYWLIDTQLFPLNIPAQPYIFFTLIITILFGYRIGTVASIFSTVLILYYLYDPRYTLDPTFHTVDFVLTLFSLGISVGIGQLLRNYERRLILESDQLKELIKARDQFTSAAAHDLRTPLTVIKLYLQSMLRSKEGTTSKAAKKSLQHIDAETDKVIELINSLFDFSRIESNKMTLTKKEADIVSLCRLTTKKLSQVHTTHSISLSCRITKLSVFIDPLAIERVLTNLITNAVKYSPQGSNIKVKLSANKRSVTLTVSDQGQGVPEELKEKLFDPFFQTSSGNSGLGLGLYIARSLVNLHKGKIWVVSNKEIGSTFYVRLPIAKAK